MLRINFLRTLSDYVSMVISGQGSLIESEGKVFGLDKLNFEDEADQNKLIGLFSEWLVFDRKQKVFDGLTGLQYFVKNNPLRLPESEINAYNDMLEFKVGHFTVKDIEMGKGVLLEFMPNSKEYFVNDVTASLSSKKEDTIWTRIAPVCGIYHMVGSLFFVIPHKINNMQRVVLGCNENSFDAKEIVSLLMKKNRFNDYISKKIEVGPSLLNPIEEYKKAETNFSNILKKCKMDSIFSVATYKKWVIDEKKFDTNFANNALFCLMPTDLGNKDFNELFDSAMKFGNRIPRSFLNGKCPSEAAMETKAKDQDLEMNVFSKEKYIKMIENGHTQMHDNNYKLAYKSFEGVVRELLKDKTPFFDAFRIYANAAVCSMANEDMGLGEELLEASLRINPQYHFAKRTIDREVAPYDDFSNVKKGYKKFAKATRGVVKEDGIRRYRRSPFRKYEDWLKKIGVSLDYETHSNITVYDKDNNKIKIGRNDPCHCGSNKKFKKCHGV
jgi:hypothetical protein